MGTKKKVERVQIRGKWFEPRLEKHEAEVNDGLWQRMVVKIVEPDKNLRVQLKSEPAKSADRTAFSLLLQAKLSGEAHIERWRVGRQDAQRRGAVQRHDPRRIDCDLKVSLGSGKLLNDVILDPRVTAVDLELIDFNLERVGVFGRDIARELSDPVKPLVAHELNRREAKIVEKANAAIDKRRDQLRFSPDKYLKSGWTQVESLLGVSPDPAKSQTSKSSSKQPESPAQPQPPQ